VFAPADAPLAGSRWVRDRVTRRRRRTPRPVRRSWPAPQRAAGGDDASSVTRRRPLRGGGDRELSSPIRAGQRVAAIRRWPRPRAPGCSASCSVGDPAARRRPPVRPCRRPGPRSRRSPTTATATSTVSSRRRRPGSPSCVRLGDRSRALSATWAAVRRRRRAIWARVPARPTCRAASARSRTRAPAVPPSAPGTRGWAASAPAYRCPAAEVGAVAADTFDLAGEDVSARTPGPHTSRLTAHATAHPWLPARAATHARPGNVTVSRFASAPRALNEPECCRCSSLSVSPGSSSSTGVRRRCGEISAYVRSMAARSTEITVTACAGGSDARHPRVLPIGAQCATRSSGRMRLASTCTRRPETDQPYRARHDPQLPDWRGSPGSRTTSRSTARSS